MEFGGWNMPRDFGGIVEEHHTVRAQAGIFDLSHMARLIVRGEKLRKKLQSIFTRSVEDMNPGQARYGFLCDKDGGCIDDIIIYLRHSDECWLVANAGNRNAVIDWLRKQFDSLSVEDRTLETALLAIQGPSAPKWFEILGLPDLPGQPFRAKWNDQTMVATTGYTGESGGECWTPVKRGREIFREALDRGLTPCGLGARDTLRLEKGYPLHGHDLSREIDPVTAGLEFFIDWNHEFIGRERLREIRDHGHEQSITPVLTSSRRSPREGQKIRDEQEREIGTITSGRYSPELEQGIGLALLDSNCEPGQHVEIEMRNDWISATIETLPFLGKE